MATRLIDIARRAGVGEATVVRTLRGSGYVSAATKARVLKAAAELDYRPNHIARSLALGKSDLVGMVTTSSLATAFRPNIEPIERAIRRSGYSMLFYLSTGYGPDAEKSCFEELLAKRVAGAIVAPASLSPDPKHYQLMLDKGIKLVIIDKYVDGIETPQIITDHYSSTRLATDHLISLGHRNIVYLAMPEDSRVGRDRASGFRDTMRAAGLPVTEASVVETDFSEEGGAAVTRKLMMRRPRPTALIARHDSVAIGAMEAVISAGLSIPKDVSLIGHANLWPCHALRVPLTSVEAPTMDVSVLAAQKLGALLAGEPVSPTTTVLGVSLVVRESTGPAPKSR